MTETFPKTMYLGRSEPFDTAKHCRRMAPSVEELADELRHGEAIVFYEYVRKGNPRRVVAARHIREVP